MWDKKKILIIGAHFDDHILGCGGIYSRGQTTVLIMSERFQFGAMNIFPMSELADHIKPLLEGKDKVFTHWPYDWNSDHKIVAEATLIACRRKEIDIYFYEVLSSTEQAVKAFRPNVYIPLTLDEIEGKSHLFDTLKHPSAQNKVRNGNNIKDWARMRGIECGHEYAEAFILFRQIEVLESEGKHIRTGGDSKT